jgi:hypothetical protein
VSDIDKKELDEYEINLKKMTEELVECQTRNDKNSCLKCDKIIGCDIRNRYVKAVYDSMSKGQSGGFEF